VASYLYRWVVTFSILFFLYKFLQPYKLGSISAMMAIGSFVPLVGMPVFQMVKFVRTPGRMRKVKKLRAASFAAVAVAIVACVLLIPTPLRVQGPLVLKVTNPDVVYAPVPGRLAKLAVRDGQWVKKGALIATLSNPEKLRERSALTEQHDSYFARSQWFGASDRTRAQEREHFFMAHDLEPAIEKVADQIGSLVLTAHQDGQVIGAPDPETIGQWVKPGKPFCEVGDPHKVEAHMILDQGDIDLVRLNRRVWVKVYGDSETTWLGTVTERAKRNREEVPPELSNQAGGEIATKQDPKSGQAKPINAIYEVTIPLDNHDLALQPGLRGFAKIDGGTHTLGWWLWRLITKTFHFTL
jgi:putative peptide zinc metalloprotease protein